MKGRRYSDVNIFSLSHDCVIKRLGLRVWIYDDFYRNFIGTFAKWRGFL